jgi:hypothetical protein
MPERGTLTGEVEASASVTGCEWLGSGGRRRPGGAHEPVPPALTVARCAATLAVAIERGTPLVDVLHAQAEGVREAGFESSG